jgi:hypothetical protein
MYSAIFEEWEIDEFWYFLCFPIKNKVLINFSSLRIYVEDTGPGKKLCRFIISECQEDDSMETVEILERAKELAIQVTFEGKLFYYCVRRNEKIQRDNNIDGEGFLLSPNHFYAPHYPNQEFFFDEQLSYTPVGHWCHFLSYYEPHRNSQMIYGLKLLPNKIPIPYTKILPRQANKNAGIQTMAKYQVSLL